MCVFRINRYIEEEEEKDGKERKRQKEIEVQYRKERAE